MTATFTAVDVKVWPSVQCGQVHVIYLRFDPAECAARCWLGRGSEIEDERRMKSFANLTRRIRHYSAYAGPGATSTWLGYKASDDDNPSTQALRPLCTNPDTVCLFTTGLSLACTPTYIHSLPLALCTKVSTLACKQIDLPCCYLASIAGNLKGSQLTAQAPHSSPINHTYLVPRHQNAERKGRPDYWLHQRHWMAGAMLHVHTVAGMVEEANTHFMSKANILVL